MFGSDNVATNVVLTTENLNSIEQTANSLFALGVRHFRYSFLSPAKDSKKMEIRDSDVIDEYFNRLRVIRDGFDWNSFNSVHAFPLCRIPVDFIKSRRSVIKCNMGVSTISVDIDNMVTPCPELPSSDFGIKIDDLINDDSQLLQAAECIPKKDSLNPICSNCQLVNYCGTGCPATRYQHTGTPVGNEYLAIAMDAKEIELKQRTIENIYYNGTSINFINDQGQYRVGVKESIISDLTVDKEFVDMFNNGAINSDDMSSFIWSATQLYRNIG
ncbi:SPASM domain-containing protein [Desulfatibacillum aliphaticivorans]|nr:SPASM domain-containing protein [Desulfatibacillum aliphaticivorans]